MNPVLRTIEVLPTNTITYHSPLARNQNLSNSRESSLDKERKSMEKPFGIVMDNVVSSCKKRNFQHNEFMGGIYDDLSKSLIRDLQDNSISVME